MKKTIQIKTTSGDVLYEHTCKDNTVKKTVEEAVKNGISLKNAILINSDLRGSYLHYADLSGACLSGADLRNSYLRHANLYDAKLTEANLYNADLCYTNLCNANISGANLNKAELHCADLFDVEVDCITSMFFPQCPDEAFIGYKKAGGKIVKLLIPEDAKRSSATTLKCRCSKAKVLEIQEIDGSPSEVKEVRSKFDNDFIYRVGETVFVEDFDDDRWNECSRGIHFFISRDAAVNYNI